MIGDIGVQGNLEQKPQRGDINIARGNAPGNVCDRVKP